VRLDANEAPDLLSDLAKERLKSAYAEIALERYPDPTLSVLKDAIAARMGVSRANVLCGVGSDEIITMLLTAFSVARSGAKVPTVVTLTPSFVMYGLSARVRGQSVVQVPLDADWDMALESTLHALDLARPSLIFIASPNNPTGTMVSLDRLRQLARRANESLLVVDEAYVDYASRDQLALFHEFENVAIMRTLSKVGFAALRVGWLLAAPDLVRELDKIRLPYNVPTPSERLAHLALGELSGEIDRITQTVTEEREALGHRLSQMGGVSVTPSEANFLWVKAARPAGEIYEALKARGILVRSFHQRGGRLASQLRITVGTPSENADFLAALGEVL
jgi:histidinol-phosphate aminotransferase